MIVSKLLSKTEVLRKVFDHWRDAYAFFAVQDKDLKLGLHRQRRTFTDGPLVHISDAGPRLSFLKWTSGEIFDDGSSTSWTDSDDRALKLLKWGRPDRWTKSFEACSKQACDRLPVSSGCLNLKWFYERCFLFCTITFGSVMSYNVKNLAMYPNEQGSDQCISSSLKLINGLIIQNFIFMRLLLMNHFESTSWTDPW